MAVPEEIRQVERPVNTVVVDRGGNGPKRFAVIERVGCKRIGGKNRPVDGKTVGHIIDGVFVPRGTKVTSRSSGKAQAPQVAKARGWARPTLVWQEAEGVFDDLCALFDTADVTEIVGIACLRVLRRGIQDSELADAYVREGLMDRLPGARLSKGEVSKFLVALGRARGRIITFMRTRISRVGDNHVIALGFTNRKDVPKTGGLAGYSWKTQTEEPDDTHVLYAYDVDSRLPLCSVAWEDDDIDASVLAGFADFHGIRNGLIIGGTASSTNTTEEADDTQPTLHWLNRLKRDDERIESFDLYGYEGILDVSHQDVKYKKARIQAGEGTRWLYSFYDRAKAGQEEREWFKAMRDKGFYDKAYADACARGFGTVILESDLDMDPEVAWRAYDERPLVENILRHCGQGAEAVDEDTYDLDLTVGNEFVNLIASVICARIVNRFEATGLLDTYAYAELMDALKSAEVVRLGEGDPWAKAATEQSVDAIIEALGLEPSSPVSGC